MKPLTPPTPAEPVIEMGQEFDSALPGETFKSVHNLAPWSLRQFKRMDYEGADATEDQRNCDAMEVRT